MSQDQMTTMIAGLNIDPHVWWLSPARAFTGDIVSTVLWLLGVAMLFPLGVFVFQPQLCRGCSGGVCDGKRKRGMDARVAQVHGGAMQSWCARSCDCWRVIPCCCRRLDCS